MFNSLYSVRSPDRTEGNVGLEGSVSSLCLEEASSSTTYAVKLCDRGMGKSEEGERAILSGWNRRQHFI